MPHRLGLQSLEIHFDQRSFLVQATVELTELLGPGPRVGGAAGPQRTRLAGTLRYETRLQTLPATTEEGWVGWLREALQDQLRDTPEAPSSAGG